MQHLLITNARYSCVLAILALHAIAASTLPVLGTEYPPWDGQENIAEYAARTGLPPSVVLNFADGDSMELVPIPPSTMKIGTPKPASRIPSLIVIGIGVVCFCMFWVKVVFPVMFKGQKLQYSLGSLVLFVLAFGLMATGTYLNIRLPKPKQPSELMLELPEQQVVIESPIYLAKREVTKAQYLHVMPSNDAVSGDVSAPMRSVSWHDAKAFCEKLAKETGLPVRLPYEGEWEFASRCGKQGRLTESKVESTTKPNEWGFVQMNNKPFLNWEWCDIPAGENSLHRVVRGSLNRRRQTDPAKRDRRNGFRIAIDMSKLLMEQKEFAVPAARQDAPAQKEVPPAPPAEQK